MVAEPQPPGRSGGHLAERGKAVRGAPECALAVGVESMKAFEQCGDTVRREREEGLQRAHLRWRKPSPAVWQYGEATVKLGQV